MVSDSLLSLALFAVVATITPGGATTLATASGGRFGFRRSVPLMAGISIGLATLAAAAAGGLAGLLLAAPALQLAMKVAGLCVALDFVLTQQTIPDQFPSFALWPALVRLAEFDAATLLGGLPLYVEGGARTVVSGAMALLIAGAMLAVAWSWRRLGPTRWFWLLGAAAPSAGLLAVGVALDTIPVELRYLASAAPFVAGLIGGAAAASARVAPRVAALGLASFLVVQAAGTLGILLHPVTQQPFRAALDTVEPFLDAETVLAVPFGNDGVGIPGSVLREMPPEQPVLILRLEDASAVPERATGFRRLVLLGIGDRDGTQQIQDASTAPHAAPTWRSQGIVWTDVRGRFAEVFERSDRS